MTASQTDPHVKACNWHTELRLIRSEVEPYLLCLLIKLNICVHDHRSEAEVRRDRWKSSSQPASEQGHLEQVA